MFYLRWIKYTLDVGHLNMSVMLSPYDLNDLAEEKKDAPT